MHGQILQTFQPNFATANNLEERRHRQKIRNIWRGHDGGFFVCFPLKLQQPGGRNINTDGNY